MRNISSWLITFFMIIFWAFRIIVTLSTQFGVEDNWAGFVVINETFEIVMLFLSLLCFILIFKRKVLGGIIYLVGYGWYFGQYLLENAVPGIQEGESMDMIVLQNVIIGVFALILGLCTVLDIAIERTKLKHFSDDKTDWYFNNEKYDRKFDERADKNQYRTL